MNRLLYSFLLSGLTACSSGNTDSSHALQVEAQKTDAANSDAKASDRADDDAGLLSSMGGSANFSTNKNDAAAKKFAVGPGKSLLWSWYNSFNSCYTWFGFFEFDGSGRKPKVYGSDSSKCLSERKSANACVYGFGDGALKCPEFHWQTANLDPGLKLETPVGAGFNFNVTQSPQGPLFTLYNNGTSPEKLDENCGKQKELSLSFFAEPTGDQMISTKEGRSYHLREMKTLYITFDAKIVLKPSICPDPKQQIAIFKPSILFDSFQNGKRVGQNAVIFDLAIESPLKKPAGSVFPEMPEVTLYNNCYNKDFPDLPICTVHVDDSVFTVKNLEDGWKSYKIDVMPLIKKYIKSGHMKSNGGGNVLDSWIRTLQFIATQRGGSVNVRMRNVNLQASRFVD